MQYITPNHEITMPDVQPLSGGAPVDVLVLVNVDEQTVFGNGSPQSPLRTNGGVVIQAAAESELVPGMCSVIERISSALELKRSVETGASLATAYCSGICVGANTDDGTAAIQSAGLVELTEDEWNTVTGSSTGLTPGDAYYASDVTAGNLTNVAPATSGHYVTLVGWAISTTQLLVQPGTPIKNP